MDQPVRTEEILEVLAVECERVAASFADEDWQAECEEWVHLNAAYQRISPAGRAPRTTEFKGTPPCVKGGVPAA